MSSQTSNWQRVFGAFAGLVIFFILGAIAGTFRADFPLSEWLQMLMLWPIPAGLVGAVIGAVFPRLMIFFFGLVPGTGG